MKSEKKSTVFLAVGLLPLFTLLALGSGCASTDSSTPAEPAHGAETRVYEVFGMDCPGCHGGLEKLIMKIPAVQQANANWQEKRVVVTVKPQSVLNDEDIYDAIRNANFTPGKRIE